LLGGSSLELCYIFAATMQKISVRTASGNYAVICGRGALRLAAAMAERLADSAGPFVLSSPRVWKLWGRSLTARFPGRNRDWNNDHRILFDDRESSKRLATVEGICRHLARAGADRPAVLVALGGGVVGDVAGFVAATYLRGVRVVHVPTTLVAQVDSAIGGKTGVNLPEGKNLVGAFYQPCQVVVDPEVLRTLPARQFRAGLYEVIKYAVIGDAALFRFLERRLGNLLRRDAATLDYIVPRCIRAKAAVVRRDEREGGVRQILNFGHTFGHALESATRYRRFLHGEAVAWGIMCATLLAVAADRLDFEDASRILHLAARVGPLPPLDGLRGDRIVEIIRGDKKSRQGRAQWVLPRKIGVVERGIEVPDAVVRKAFVELPRLFAAARGRS
jgi:3-dehydroquinate synthase